MKKNYKKITTYSLIALVAFIQLNAQEENNQLNIEKNIEEIKHAGTHVEEIIIDKPDFYDHNDEKHAGTHVEEIIISDNNSSHQDMHDDSFLDTIADDVRTEAPHEPRDTSSLIAQVAIAAKIAHKMSVDFYEETLKPSVVGFWNSVTNLV
ncbi:hypothetical protein EBU24_01535 [bacterium]|nr:hypothetical protein [bacterium]